MTTYARVPVVPGPVLEIYVGGKLFPMHADIAASFHTAPEGTLAGYQFDGVNYTAPVPPAADPNAAIKAQIAALEASITSRMIQEAVSGSNNVFPTSSTYAGKTAAQAIAEIVAQKAALRAQLQ